MRAALTCLFVALTAGVALGQPTDEEALAKVVSNAAERTAAQLPPGSIALNIHPADAHPIVRQSFSRELVRRGIGVHTNPEAAGAVLTIDIRGMNSSTAPLDESLYLRTVEFSAGALAESNIADSVLLAEDLQYSATDTLRGSPEYSERDFLEVESASWFERALTPIIVTAAAVVVVVLLFSVRES